MTPAAPKTDRSAATQDAIRTAARLLFTSQGFSGTGVRDIAREAGTDPALVIRHFGSKEGLFLATVEMSDFWTTLLDGPVDGLGERVARAIVEARVGHLGAYTALIRASDRPEVRARLQQSTMSTLIEPLLRRLNQGQSELRAHLFAAQLDGLLTALTVREDPVFVDSDPDLLVAWYGPVLQHALTGPAPAVGEGSQSARSADGPNRRR